MNIIAKLGSIFLAISLICFNLNSEELSAKPAQQYKLGMLLTLSGPFASAGEDCRKGIEAAFEVSGKKDLVELVYSDSKNDPSNAISEFRRLSNLENMIAVYTHRGAIALPLNPISRALKIPMLAAVGPKVFAADSEFAYQAWATADEDGQTMAAELIKSGLRKVAIVTSEDEWTEAVTAALVEKFEEMGGVVVFNEFVQPAETDFRSLLLKLRNKTTEALYFNVLLPQIGVILRQAKQLSITGQYFSNFYVSKKEVLDSAGIDSIKGVRYLEIDTNLPKLTKALNLGANEAPAALTVASYVASMMIIQSISEGKSIDSPEVFNKLLQSQKEIITPDFTYKVTNRYIRFPLVMKVIGSAK